MIYSKRLQTFTPINVSKQEFTIDNFGKLTKYIVKDKRIPVGFVDLRDTPNGVFVEMIKNNYPELYSGFAKVADQIEVEHCLNRNMENFTIDSNAALNSHALHYKRGKRFAHITDKAKIAELEEKFHTTDVNLIVEKIIKATKAGEQYITKFLGSVPMYMPQELIIKYLEIIKNNPLLK